MTRRSGRVSLRDPLVPLDFGGWVRRVWGVWRRWFAPLAVLALVPAVVQVVFACVMDVVRLSPAEVSRRLAAAGPVDELTAAGIAGLPTLPVAAVFAVPVVVATAFFLACAYCLVVRRSNGQPIGPGAALRVAAAQVPRFVVGMVGFWLGTAIVFFVLVLPGTLLGSAMAQGAGLVLGGLLLIVLGVLFFATFPGVVVIERAGIARCFQLVRVAFWSVVGRMVVVGLVYYAYSVALGRVLTLATAPFGGAPAIPGVGSVALHIAQEALTIPLSVFVAAATLITYAELRNRENPGINTHVLAAEITR